MTSEQSERMDELFFVLVALQQSGFLFRAARVMELDEGDKESCDALLNIFEERIQGEIKRLEEVYEALFDLLVSEGKVGF